MNEKTKPRIWALTVELLRHISTTLDGGEEILSHWKLNVQGRGESAIFDVTDGSVPRNVKEQDPK